MRLLILSSLLFLAGCVSPAKLPDPTTKLKPVPAALVQPAQKMKTIPVEKTPSDNNRNP